MLSAYIGSVWCTDEVVVEIVYPLVVSSFEVIGIIHTGAACVELRGLYVEVVANVAQRKVAVAVFDVTFLVMDVDQLVGSAGVFSKDSAADVACDEY
eukprot:3661541-Amphidinium_carterae.1